MNSQNNHKTRLVENALAALQKEYVFVGKRRVRGWHAWLVIGVVAGIAAGIILVAQRSGEFSEIETAPPTLTAPQQLSANAVSASAIDLSWRDRAKTEDGFEIYRSLDHGYVKIGVAPRDAAFYGDSDLKPQTNYSYRVRAFQFFEGTVAYSQYSNVTSATTLPGPVSEQNDFTSPTVPTGLSATPISSHQISLSWNASTDDIGVAGYRVFRDNILVIKVSNTSFIDSDLYPATTYTYQVAAYDSAGNVSAKSESVQALRLRNKLDI